MEYVNMQFHDFSGGPQLALSSVTTSPIPSQIPINHTTGHLESMNLVILIVGSVVDLVKIKSILLQNSKLQQTLRDKLLSDVLSTVTSNNSYHRILNAQQP